MPAWLAAWGVSRRRWRIPRGAGVAASLILLLASGAYGAMKGDHLPTVVAQFKDTRDALANAAGFGIGSLSVLGRRNLTEREVLAAAGVNERTSLVFFDAEEARQRLKANPWVADATVRKFYPGRLQIEIEERDAFALWQKEGKLSLIAADGAVLAPYNRAFAKLPLLVGSGAEVKGKEFLAILEKFPTLRDQVRASILIAERRWNLRLKNGIDVRLPELDVAKSLDRLAHLDREKKLLSRDVSTVDLRLPDRVGVRLSEAAAQARDELLKPKKPKRKGTDA
jgi:cell division protein FtsQ